MKFTFKPNEYATRHFFDDRNRSEAKVQEEKKWNKYTSAVDTYRQDKERFISHAGTVGKLPQARELLQKMEVDPTTDDPKGFLEDFPKWPERSYSGDFHRIPLMQLKHHRYDFEHLGAHPNKLVSVDMSISEMNSSLSLVKESSVKSLFKKKNSVNADSEWVYTVPPQDVRLGEDRAVLALSSMAVHEFNRRSDKLEVYLHARVELNPSDPTILDYVLLYPEDNAERHIWREIFLGIPRPQGSLLPPPFVADIPKPPPYVTTSKTSLDKMKQLIETKNMLRLHGADDETLAAVTNQIAKLAVGTTDQSQQASRSRTRASDQNFV